MATKRYRVSEISGYDGIERLRDAPVGRRVYRSGELIELDDALDSVTALLASGAIIELPEPPEPPAPKSKKDKEV